MGKEDLFYLCSGCKEAGNLNKAMKCQVPYHKNFIEKFRKVAFCFETLKKVGRDALEGIENPISDRNGRDPVQGKQRHHGGSRFHHIPGKE